MPCPECEEPNLIQGKCSTPDCPNRRTLPEPGADRPKTKLKRTPMRKKSAKKRKEEKETKAIRRLRPGERCELCNGTNAVSTHEVPAGSHRHRAVYDRRCQMRVCIDCHKHIQGLSYTMQIVLKIEAMMAGINEATGRVAVTLEEIRDSL